MKTELLPPPDELINAFAKAGQGHVFAFYDSLGTAARNQLLRQAAAIDLTEVEALCADLLDGASAPLNPESLAPAPYMAHPSCGGDRMLWKLAHATGERLLKQGRVAAFTVAGGQGTRLGYDGPKGAFPVTPVRQAPLFQVFAEQIRAAGKRYGVVIPWLIMTSELNHAATESFFRDHNWFGLDETQVMLFPQGLMPAVDNQGKILLAAKDSIALSPDGHGGSLRALVRSGLAARLREQEIDTISYFQVDNPLVHCLDPAFIGFHHQEESELSSKMLMKSGPAEKVGHFCLRDGQLEVIEYSDMPPELAELRQADGSLRFGAGSIAIHLFDLGLIERLGDPCSRDKLPFHRALKKVPHVTPDGEAIDPTEPNGIKFEMFVFDALAFATHPIIVETTRLGDFSPVKNSSGGDSPDTARADQLRRWAAWMTAAGIELACDESGLPEHVFEITPLFARTAAEFKTAWEALDPKPAIRDGLILTTE